MFWDILVQSLIAIGGKAANFLDLASFTNDRKDQRSKVRWEIARSYRESWAEVRAIPGWEGINDRNRDLRKSPRTENETRCIRILLFHFSRALKEHRSGRYDLPKGLEADVRNFFSYPVRADAWHELKQYHDPEVVSFVERVLAGPR